MKNRKAEVDAVASTFNYSNFKYQLNLATSMGDILIDMWGHKAPGHVTNMLGLAKIGYYDGLTFHRVIKGFMIQGGCPMGSGVGGPGYTIKQEFNESPHEPGVLSMARTSDPDSAGSQFFLCLEKSSFLDRQYTAFGQTANPESLKVVREIGAIKTGSQDRPVVAVTIDKATIIETPM